MKIFRMDDETWWIAESMVSAVTDYVNETGEDPDDAYELNDAELDLLQMEESEDGPPCSFREQMQRHIDNKHSIPGFFAGTEW